MPTSVTPDADIRDTDDTVRDTDATVRDTDDEQC